MKPVANDKGFTPSVQALIRASVHVREVTIRLNDYVRAATHGPTWDTLFDIEHDAEGRPAPAAVAKWVGRALRIAEHAALTGGKCQRSTGGEAIRDAYGAHIELAATCRLALSLWPEAIDADKVARINLARGEAEFDVFAAGNSLLRRIAKRLKWAKAPTLESIMDKDFAEQAAAVGMTLREWFAAEAPAL